MLLKNARGSSLIEVLFAAVIVGIISIAITSLISDQNKQMKSMTEKMQISESERALQMAFTNPDYCSCVFRGKTLNTVSSPNVWSSSPTSLPLNFTTIPAFPGTCTAGSAMIIPPVSSTMPNQTMKVHGINIADITETSPGSGNYTAQLVVDFDNTIQVLKPTKLAFAFSIDTGSGTATARPFLSCGNVAGLGPTVCPAGMTRIGPPGARATFCIDTVSRGMQIAKNAISICAATVVTTDFGTGHLCSLAEWSKACRSSLVPSMLTSDDLLNEPNMYSAGNSTWAMTSHTRPDPCTGVFATWDTTPRTFRCCL